MGNSTVRNAGLTHIHRGFRKEPADPEIGRCGGGVACNSSLGVSTALSPLPLSHRGCQRERVPHREWRMSGFVKQFDTPEEVNTVCVCARARVCVCACACVCRLVSLSLSRARSRARSQCSVCAPVRACVCARARQRYRLEKRVGKGSYGVVYEALDTETGDK